MNTDVPAHNLETMAAFILHGIEPGDDATDEATVARFQAMLDEWTDEAFADVMKSLFVNNLYPSAGLERARRMGLIARHWPEIDALAGTPQEPEWHPEGDVWQHTLQVVDAAASIADREIGAGALSPDDDDRLLLVLGALCHDIGKPDTTCVIDGRITSRGHESKGVPIARAFLDRAFRDPSITRRVLPLVAEHMNPPIMWQNVRKGIPQDKAIRSLERRLRSGNPKVYPDGGSSTLYLLSSIAEADQRGRNPASMTPLLRHHVPDLDDWHAWILHHHHAIRHAAQQSQPPITGEQLVAHLGTGPGPHIGVVLRCLTLDQRDGLITTEAQCLQRATLHHDRLSRHVAHTGADPAPRARHNGWNVLNRLDDPRSPRIDTPHSMTASGV